MSAADMQLVGWPEPACVVDSRECRRSFCAMRKRVASSTAMGWGPFVGGRRAARLVRGRGDGQVPERGIVGPKEDAREHGTREARVAAPPHQGDGGDGRRRDLGDPGHRDPRAVHRQRPPRLPARPLPHRRPPPVRVARALHRLPRGPEGEEGAAAGVLDVLRAPREAARLHDQGGALRVGLHQVPAAALAAAREAHRARRAPGDHGLHRPLHAARRHRVADRPHRARLRGLGHRAELLHHQARAAPPSASCATPSSIPTGPGRTRSSGAS